MGPAARATPHPADGATKDAKAHHHGRDQHGRKARALDSALPPRPVR